MINFITAPDAMREYDIGEEQLFEVIESGLAAPYDSARAKLSAAGFDELVEVNIEAEVSRAQRYFSNRAPQPDIWSRSYERDMARLERLQAQLDESCREIEARVPLQVLHSVCFVRDELEAALREVCPVFFQNYLASKKPPGAIEPAPVPARTKEKGGKIRNTSGSTPDIQGMTATNRAFNAIEQREGPEVIGSMTRDQLKGMVKKEVESEGGNFHAMQYDICWSGSLWTNRIGGRRSKQGPGEE